MGFVPNVTRLNGTRVVYVPTGASSTYWVSVGQRFVGTVKAITRGRWIAVSSGRHGGVATCADRTRDGATAAMLAKSNPTPPESGS